MSKLNQLLLDAQREHGAGNWARARQLYLQILETDPRHAEAWHLLGALAYQANNHALAIEFMEKALAIDASQPNFHANLGCAYRAVGNLAKAETALKKAARLSPRDPEVHVNLGAVLMEAEKLDEAEPALRTATELAPRHPLALNNLGNLLRKRGRPREAEACYRQALAGSGRNALIENNLGVVLQEQGRAEDALAAYRRALAIQPALTDAHIHLGACLALLGRLPEAEHSYREALRLKPESAETRRKLGNVLHAQEKWSEAANEFRLAIEGTVDSAGNYNDLGVCLVRLDRMDEAIQCFEETVGRSPSFVVGWINLANALVDRGDAEKAAGCYRKALELQPDNLDARMALAACAPFVYRSRDELLQTRARLLEDVRRFRAGGLKLDPTKVTLPIGVYYSVYQGFNERDLRRDFSSLYYEPDQAPASSSTRERSSIHIGFLSRHLYNHTIGRVMRGIIAHLSRPEFVVHVLAVERRQDSVTAFIRQHCDVHVELPVNDIATARKNVRDLRLDILFYPDIGTEPISHALALSRLAPVQCVGWGHPTTTGIPTLDYYVSSALYEGPGAEEHYTEKLVRLSTLLAYYYRPALANTSRDRRSFGLPDDCHLYGCLQSLFKMHPDFDAILGEILRRDARGLILVPHGSHRRWDELLLERWSRTIPDVLDRIRFMPWQGRSEFLGLVANCDVLLDTIHFNGGTTSYECLEVGTPIVTWPSEFLRGRLTFGLYKQMNVLDCVARDWPHYVELAVQLGTERAYREHVRAKILEAKDVLFENLDVVRAYEGFFRQAVARDSHAR